MRDELFAQPRKQVQDFNFDAPVADVFEDMIRRSLPGYDCVQSMLGVIAARFAQADTHVYDLGCSLGSGTLAMHEALSGRHVTLVGVDKSAAMVDRARRRFETCSGAERIQLLCQDICELEFETTSLVVLNFTLQFIAPRQRSKLLAKALGAIVPGGALVLSEKVDFADPREGSLMGDLHDDFRRANGYSHLEISQKRSALENVLVTETEARHIERLEYVGFDAVHPWFRCANFISLLAVKAS